MYRYWYSYQNLGMGRVVVKKGLMGNEKFFDWNQYVPNIIKLNINKKFLLPIIIEIA